MGNGTADGPVPVAVEGDGGPAGGPEGHAVPQDPLELVALPPGSRALPLVRRIEVVAFS